jgi:ABC-type multidrug transport system fused ATPase/permease subunit
MESASYQPVGWWDTIAQFAGQRKDLLAMTLIAALFSAACEVAFPWFLQVGIDSALGEPTPMSLYSSAMAMGVVLILIVAGHSLTLQLQAILLSSAAAGLRARLYRNFHFAPLSKVSRLSPASLGYRLVHDTNSLSSGLSELIGSASFDLLLSVGVLCMMLRTHVSLTLLIVGLLTGITFASSRLGERVPALKRATMLMGARLVGALQESLGNARTIRAFGAEEQHLGRLDSINLQVYRTEFATGRFRALVTPLWNLAESVCLILVLAVGGHMLVKKQISAGTLISFMAYMELLSGPIARCGEYFLALQNCKGMAERIASLLDVQGEESGPEEAPLKIGSIRFENVRFRYPGAANDTLHDLNFNLNERRTTALIGRNGSGKSTILDLLLRFHSPSQGRILVGESTLENWPTSAWRSRIGVVFQDTALFRATVAENIAMGKDNTREDIIAALESAGGSELLQKLKRGIDTNLGNEGAGLSGGERQLIGIARLFLRNPQVVLLDEPTAHLDGAISETVRRGIARLVRGRTALIVTHHRDLLSIADDVILLDRGTIVSTGAPAEISRKNELFRSLFGRISTPEAGN